ncbi:PREDICTED: protein VASCULAR ASSOCIATED DEATH 1, chloroplastic isoform X2 [Tarenaya hassleriana]|uniref:protein VASCULAR ASSOCIATED DEATH 1, chloroplastic isoform X2 n=1 Tax=Tarenaya hassleriana TaxID=28532 RepID=UPI00053C30FE|nr:PREDICTED: protein VASCULAR ASSOCIATED DEATH 1, chloroplastic isoform X2 [Tarenaya hassleriana]
MALVSAASTPESIDLPRSMVIDATPPEFSSPVILSDPSPSSPHGSGDDSSTSSPNPSGSGYNQSEVAIRNEEYRQLFRLPAEEVLVQDFNCACQESILLQGHMYLFVRYICFYSNIFGFETKKVIPFEEVTCVKRAKTAGIFPNAIEIVAGEKKYFFASFLSRDEAFKLIHDLWLDHGNASKAKCEVQVVEGQDSFSETNGEVNGVTVERTINSEEMVNGLDSSIRDENICISRNSGPPVISHNDVPRSSNAAQQHTEPVDHSVPSSSTNSLNWKIEDLDAPKISADFTKVAETQFLVSVEEFFSLFFSDDAVDFVESFHKNCGDKEFRCTSWQSHERLGHSRSVSFQHPIKIYFGAKFGSCHETQKFRVYRNGHLVIETSQEINDVPYGDYFTVEGLWDVQRECRGSKEGCILRVYVNVAFTKRTVWKGKIVQSTLEECKEAYATWIKMAHGVLKQKNLEEQGDGKSSVSQSSGQVSVGEGRKEEETERRRSESDELSTGVVVVDEGNMMRGYVNRAGSMVREAWVNMTSFMNSQGRKAPQLLIIAFAVILLMQVTIVVLLKRPQQQIQVVAWEKGGGEMMWLEKRVHFLREEVLMMEARLERMRQDHASLKAHLTDLEQLLLRQSSDHHP